MNDKARGSFAALDRFSIRPTTASRSTKYWLCSKYSTARSTWSFVRKRRDLVTAA